MGGVWEGGWMKVGFSGYGQNERRFYYVKSIFLSKISRSGLAAYFFNFPVHNLGPGFLRPQVPTACYLRAEVHTRAPKN